MQTQPANNLIKFTGTGNHNVWLRNSRKLLAHAKNSCWLDTLTRNKTVSRQYDKTLTLSEKDHEKPLKT